MKAIEFLGAVALAVVAAVPPTAARDESGVKLSRPSYVRKLVSAEKIETGAAMEYNELTRQAFQRNKLLGDENAQVKHVRRIAKELLPFANRFNDRAEKWQWDINLIDSPIINAFCMPGGKIAVFTGILEKLNLTDDEVALVVGHEIAHALREHARERAAKSTLTGLGALAVSVLVGGNAGEIARVGGTLMNLKFSRNDESEADLIGMEMAARAGYDPRAGITLWQKMSAAAKGAPPAWLSTHPSNKARITWMEKNMPDVLPLYEEAKAKKSG
jgi:predicted Zn-dependent protease